MALEKLPSHKIDVWRDLPAIKSGVEFGGSGDDAFNDSLIDGFAQSYYLRGMITGSKMKPLEWCQFLYSSPDTSENTLESEVHGTRQSVNDIDRLFLSENQRISKVQVLVDDEMIDVNGILQLVSLIRGIRLFTTDGQASQSIDHLRGELCMEKFDGYTVKYVTGRSGLYIDQLQFHWYRDGIN
ncbi:unnamed protein product [Rotaria sordida]|uniref:Uncharacterized protein n=1 Tax=Rotaria sordida TaxID=392033 RepID=A0A815P6D9_9BILA|nr:unnamed protein product [Rotaria sordida]CAF4064364.1 unnamed protein product [Rotaria sordida]